MTAIPDPLEESPAVCSCPDPGVVFYRGHYREDCPAAAVPVPRPRYRPGPWGDWQ